MNQPRQDLTVKDFRTQLDQMKPQFQSALPAHVTPEKFMRVVLTAVSMQPALLTAERKSLLGACMKCAQDGLLPDNRDAAFVLFWDRKSNQQKAQYMPMIAGVLKKVRNSGELASITSNVVYERDHFAYQLGDDERIEHTPVLSGDRGKPIAVYAIATLRSGEKVREVMTFGEVEQVRNVSKAKDNGPWVEWWGEMARKTVMRRLSKRLPMSTDLERVLTRDDELYDLNAKVQGGGASRTQQVLSLLTGGAEAAPAAEPEHEPEPEVEPRSAKPRGRPRKAKVESVDPDTGEITDREPGSDDDDSEGTDVEGQGSMFE